MLCQAVLGRTEQIQGSHRLEKALNLKGCLEKALNLNLPGKGLENGPFALKRP